jgi:hypothetical protein
VPSGRAAPRAMVFVFVGPGGMAVNGLRLRAGDGDVRGTAVLSLALMLASVVLGSSHPYFVPLLTVVIHLFPEAVDRAREWCVANLFGVVVGAFSLLVLFAPSPSEWFGTAETGAEERARRGGAREYSELHVERAASRSGARSGSGAGADAGSPGDHSATRAVVTDLSFTLVLLLSVFLLPQLWVRLNAWALRALPEDARASWRRWTEVLQPRAAPVGSVPASQRAVVELENLVLEERHLLAEGCPGGIACAICLDNMGVGARTKRLPCKHIFHPSCLMPWLDKHNSCPTCRFELETNDPEYELERRERQEAQERQRRERTERSPGVRPSPSPTSQAQQQPQPQPQPQQQQQPARPGSPQVARSPVARPSAARVPAAASATYDDDPLRDYERAVERERLSSMSIVELKTIARHRGISVAGLLEKQELINAIVARYAS